MVPLEAQRHDGGLDPGARASQDGGWLLITIVIVLCGGLAALSLLSSRSGEPLVLTILALLAMVGAFFLFGLAAGYIRMGDRPDDRDLLLDVADQSGVGLILVGPEGAPVHANAAYRELTSGGTLSLDDVFAGEPQAAECLFRLSRAAERTEPHEEVVRVRGSDGTRQARYFRVSVAPFRSLSPLAGAGPLTLWRVADITAERSRDVETVRGLEAALAVYDRLPLGLLTVSPTGRVTLANAAMLERLGLAPGALRSGNVSIDDVMTPDSATVVRGLWRARREGTAMLDLELTPGQGTSERVQALVAPRLGGEPTGELTVVVVDRAAPVLDTAPGEDAEVRFARFFHAAPFGIATVDRGGRILNANASFARMFFDGQSTSAAAVTDLFPLETDGEARGQVLGALTQVLGGQPFSGPLEIAVGPERRFTRRIFMSAISSARQGSEAAVLYVIDATEQKALEHMFAQSQKMEAIGKLAGGIAHDFNNVLTVIIGLSDLLLRSRRPTDPGYTDMMQIRSNANRAAGMVRQLVAFSRKQTLTPEVLALNDLVQDLGYSLNRLLGEQIELKVSAGRDLWQVKADRTQLEQVMINLAVNARDAMPDGGRLTVRTRNVPERETTRLKAQGVVPGEYVAVEVADTGTGMTPEVMAKIFEPFFTTKEIGKGTGLGLATVYGIVKQTGGYIFVDSEVGKGTTFRVYLRRYVPEPAKADEPAAKAQARKDRPRDLTGSGRVLLVEDEDAVRGFAVRALKQQGYSVLEAASGAEALDVMREAGGKVDIVVSDVLMPEMDGPTLLKELRKDRPDLKFIFVSGYADDAIKKSLAENESFAFLSKPFTLAQLAAKVKEELGS